MIAVGSIARWMSSRSTRLRGDVLPLRNHPTEFRKRVGDDRIFFDVEHHQRLIRVHAIIRRSSTTYRGRR
jgi:hypothetical protein